MTPLFSLAAAALLPWGHNAFVVVPAATSLGGRGGNVARPESRIRANPTAEALQQREDARAALLESGGVDELLRKIAIMRGEESEEGAAAAPAAAAAPPAAKKVGTAAVDVYDMF